MLTAGRRRVAGAITLLIGMMVSASGAAAANVVEMCEGEIATHVGTNGDDVIIGTSGPDVIVALGGDDFIRGLGGDDIICAGVGNDEARGGYGDDIIRGGRGRDLLVGGPGNDRLQGLADNDVLRGRGGNDELFGNPGRDKLFGNKGNDYFNGGRGTDECYGGYGSDSGDSCETAKSIENKPPSCDLVPYADLRGCDLNGKNLDGLDLTGINFAGGVANELSMRGTIFDGANLSGATMVGRYRPVGNVKEASFVGTDLSNATLGSWTGPDADFTDANLSGVFGDRRNGPNQPVTLLRPIFRNADLSGANFTTRSSFEDGVFSGADLTNLRVAWLSGDFTGAISLDGLRFNRLGGSGLEGRTLTGLVCEPTGRYESLGSIDASVGATTFAGFSSYGCDMSGNFVGTRFLDAIFRGGNNEAESTGRWTSVVLAGLTTDQLHHWSIELIDSNLSGWHDSEVSWSGDVAIAGSDLSGWINSSVSFGLGGITVTDISGWDESSQLSLSGTILDTVDLSGTRVVASNVTWTNVTCPDGTNSDANGFTCVGHLTP